MTQTRTARRKQGVYPIVTVTRVLYSVSHHLRITVHQKISKHHPVKIRLKPDSHKWGTLFLTDFHISFKYLIKILIGACPSQCYTCNGGTCRRWCSEWNWCGSSYDYTGAFSTDCRNCIDGIWYILIFYLLTYSY